MTYFDIGLVAFFSFILGVVVAVITKTSILDESYENGYDDGNDEGYSAGWDAAMAVRDAFLNKGE